MGNECPPQFRLRLKAPLPNIVTVVMFVNAEFSIVSTVNIVKYVHIGMCLQRVKSNRFLTVRIASICRLPLASTAPELLDM
jgi:hypothetical protein